MNWAKWLLGGIGWAAGGPIGALIGYLIGKRIGNNGPKLESDNDWTHQASSSSSNNRRGPYRNTGSQNDVYVALLVLIAAVMKADGEVKQSELNHVKSFLNKNFTEDEAKQLLRTLRDIVKQDIDINSVCQQIKQNTSYTTRYHMFDFLYGLAGADNDYHDNEEAVLNNIRRGLGINVSDFLSIRERHRGYSSYNGGYSGGYNRGYNSGSNRGYRQSSGSSQSSYTKDPYKILGISSTATDDEVKKAYRRLAMKYHPDKMENMGESMKKQAEAQFREINEAYETIKRARGIK